MKQNREQIGSFSNITRSLPKVSFLETLFGDTGKQLTTISDEIGSDMDKTKSREKYINQQLESLITELRTSHDKLAQAKVNILSTQTLPEVLQKVNRTF